MKPDRLTLTSITVFGAAMIALSACSAGSGSTVAAGSGSAGGAAAGGSASSNAIFGLTGKPIVVADISDLTGIPGFDPSGFAAGARAAASYINAQGGIDGRPIQVTSCDDAMNPGLEDALPEIDDDYQKSRTGATSSSLFAIAAKLGRLTPCFKVHGF